MFFIDAIRARFALIIAVRRGRRTEVDMNRNLFGLSVAFLLLIMLLPFPFAGCAEREEGILPFFSKKIEIDRVLPIYVPAEAQVVFDKYGYEPSGKLTNYNQGVRLSLDALISRYGFLRVKQYIWRALDHLVLKLSKFHYDKNQVEIVTNRRNSYYSRIASTVDMSLDMRNYLKYKAENAEKLAELRETF